MELIALEMRRKLWQVNVRKDFWDRYQGQRKKLANSWLVPRKNCGKHFSSSSLLLSKVVNKKITWIYINPVWLLEITRKVVNEPSSYTCCLERWAGVSACYKTTKKRYSYRGKVQKQVFMSFLCWNNKRPRCNVKEFVICFSAVSGVYLPLRKRMAQEPKVFIILLPGLAIAP